MSLADYAKPTCPVCALPKQLLKEMIEGYAQGIRYKAIATWLESEHNTPISATKIETHFQRGHDARKSN